MKYVTARFAVPYMVSPVIMASFDPYPSTLYICPKPCCTIPANATRDPRTVPLRSTSRMNETSRSSSSHTGLLGELTPALFTQMSTAENACVAWSHRFPSCPGSVTSQGTAMTLVSAGPTPLSSSRAAARFSSFTPETTTLHPSSLNFFAWQSPKPLVDPVMTIVFMCVLLPPSRLDEHDTLKLRSNGSTAAVRTRKPSSQTDTAGNRANVRTTLVGTEDEGGRAWHAR